MASTGSQCFGDERFGGLCVGRQSPCVHDRRSPRMRGSYSRQSLADNWQSCGQPRPTRVRSKQKEQKGYAGVTHALRRTGKASKAASSSQPLGAPVRGSTCRRPYPPGSAGRRRAGGVCAASVLPSRGVASGPGSTRCIRGWGEGCLGGRAEVDSALRERVRAPHGGLLGSYATSCRCRTALSPRIPAPASLDFLGCCRISKDFITTLAGCYYDWNRKTLGLHSVLPSRLALVVLPTETVVARRLARGELADADALAENGCDTGIAPTVFALASTLEMLVLVLARGFGRLHNSGIFQYLKFCLIDV